MSGSSSAISAPLFYEPSASKDKQGELKNWLNRSVKWFYTYIASFDGAYSAAKVIRYTSDWIGKGLTPRVEAGGSGAGALSNATILRRFGANAEHLLNAFNIPGAFARAALSIKGVFSAFTADPAKRSPGDKAKAQTVFKAALDVNDIADPVCDGITLLKDLKLVNLGSVASQAVEGVASGSLFITSTVRGVKSGWDVANSATKMNRGDAATVQAERKQVVVGLLNMAKWISFFALSVIGLVGLIVVGIPAWAALAAMTSALIFGIFAAYATEVLVGKMPAPRNWLSKAIV